MPDHGLEGVGEVDAEDLLEALGAENVHDVGRDEVGFSCLWIAGHAHGDRNPSAHINRDSLLWRCKGCGRAGNLVQLVQVGLEDHPSQVQALRWLMENFGEMERKPQGGSLTADLEARLAAARYVPPERKLPDEEETIGPQGIFKIDWRSNHPAALYMRGRGFDPEVLEDWKLGFDSWTNRVAIPVRDPDGALVGFKGRAIDDSSVKYLLLGDKEGRRPRYDVGFGFDMHDARSVLFGIDRARGSKRVLMPEGELDAIAANAAGVPSVAPGTKSITKEQLWLLRAHFDEIVFCFDAGAGDEAVWGKEGPDGKWMQGLIETLSPYFVLYDCPEHEGDPASMTPGEIRNLTARAEHWLGLAFQP